MISSLFQDSRQFGARRKTIGQVDIGGNSHTVSHRDVNRTPNDSHIVGRFPNLRAIPPDGAIGSLDRWYRTVIVLGNCRMVSTPGRENNQ
jgi:hypothetical protein